MWHISIYHDGMTSYMNTGGNFQDAYNSVLNQAYDRGITVGKIVMVYYK